MGALRSLERSSQLQHHWVIIASLSPSLLVLFGCPLIDGTIKWLQGSRCEVTWSSQKVTEAHGCKQTIQISVSSLFPPILSLQPLLLPPGSQHALWPFQKHSFPFSHAVPPPCDSTSATTAQMLSARERKADKHTYMRQEMTVAQADEKHAKLRELKRFLSCKGLQIQFQISVSVEFMFLVVGTHEVYTQGISMLCC